MKRKYNDEIHQARAQAALGAHGCHPETARRLVERHGHETIFRILKKELHLLEKLVREVEEIEEILEHEHPIARSGTTLFKSKTGDETDMDLNVHVNDTPKIAVAKEWTGANGTGTLVPPTGAITFKSDNEAAVTVDPNTGALTYVAPGVANISWTDAGLPDLPVQAGQITVTVAPAVSGTTEFVDAPPVQ